MDSRTQHSKRSSGLQASPDKAPREVDEPPRRLSSSKTQSGVDALLELLDDAISIIATAASALEAAQDSIVIDNTAKVGDMIKCLVHGVGAVRRSYDALEVAVREVRS